MNIPDRIYAQYRNKPKATNWYAICRTLGGEIDAAAQAVRKSYNINTAVGEQLDIIGRIVVINRNYLGNTSLMTDELFRIVLRAKIIKNNSDATIESILEGMSFILPTGNITRVIDLEDMSFGIEFAGQITDVERYALVNAIFVPRPQGVRFGWFLESYIPSEFGDTASQFGDTNAQFHGYI